MKKIAIIGASYLQLPLILKAKEKNLETHVFAWGVGDVGEKVADFFYPISIIEKDRILEECIKIDIDGICTIASDLAVSTVSYVAEKMGLIGNSIESAQYSTNKHLMRTQFDKYNLPSPRSRLVNGYDEVCHQTFKYPIIVKAIDRSGSRGVTKLDSDRYLKDAILFAIEEGFEKKALIEEYVDGDEYSIECISWEGKHTFLTATKKYTSGPPHFVETGHIEPSGLDSVLLDRIKDIVFCALDSLNVKYGASHSEIKVTPEGNVMIIEIGARMGGDHIGSILVEQSTGFDYVGAVIDIALGNKPKIEVRDNNIIVGIRYILNQEDLNVYCKVCGDDRIHFVDKSIPTGQLFNQKEITSSSERFGYFIIKSDKREIIEKNMPCEG